MRARSPRSARRNVALVEQAVTESRTYTEQEAATADPPLIDVIAADLPDLLKKLDGRTIRRFDGTQHDASDARRRAALGRDDVGAEGAERRRPPADCLSAADARHARAHRRVVESRRDPARRRGGICLLLAFFAFQVLPVSYAGVLLILFGLVLLILEVKVTSFGLLAVGGVLSLFFGSILLMDSPLPELQVGLRLIIPVTLTLSAIILFLVQLAVKAQRSQPITGEAGMLEQRRAGPDVD